MRITDDDLREAIKRIGLTPDGELLYLMLQQALHSVSEIYDPGALQRENGKRILAHNLMVMLSAGIDEIHAGSRTDRIIVFKQPGAADVRGSGGARTNGAARRVPTGYPEPGDAGIPGPGDAA